MAIKKYFSIADTTISNALDQSLLTENSATGSNMGASDILEVFRLHAQLSSSTGLSSELSRVLIQFDTTNIASDRTATNIPVSGNVSFYLKMYNARHSSTLPEDFTLTVSAVSQSWEEGNGLDMENYTDKTFQKTGSTWESRGSSGTWNTAGGDYHSEPTFNQTFQEGFEDLELDVTDLVEQWLNGTKENYGFGVALTASLESISKSYYTKKFFARGTEFYYKRPVLEARWDDSTQDDRGYFFLSSSLAPAEDNINTLFLYNVVRGRLRNIPSIGKDTLRVSLFSGSTAPTGKALTLVADGNNVLENHELVVTGGHISTGIYTASVAFTGSTDLTKVYDVWFSGSTSVTNAAAASLQFHTGAIELNTITADGYNPSNRYILSISNMRETYSVDEKARFKLYVRPRNWSPTIFTKANDVPETTIISSASYEIFRASDNLKIIPFGTGSDMHTALSYNVSGNYFDLDMSCFEGGEMYGVRFAFYDDAVGSWNTQPYEFKFKVSRDEY